jgi:hypothetical protein
MRDTGLIEKYTVQELFREMETLTKINYSGKYGHILTELARPQKVRKTFSRHSICPYMIRHRYNLPGN